jgi:GGDEF domain-containing protein
MYKDIAEIILCHHERYDGKGYPKGLKGDEIPMFGRIIKIADSFDAMTTNRIYKSRISVPQAMKELKDCSGSEFHPKVVESAIKALKNVKLASNITQLPKTYLEKERFSYFYRDQITQAYNVTYLDVILNANSYEKEYKSIQLLYLNNFSAYNKKHSWSAGNQLLSDFVDYLSLSYPKSIIFRFHGDDFVLISKDKLSIDEGSLQRLDMLAKNSIHVSTLHINIEEKNICSLKELEAIS